MRVPIPSIPSIDTAFLRCVSGRAQLGPDSLLVPVHVHPVARPVVCVRILELLHELIKLGASQRNCSGATERAASMTGPQSSSPRA